MKKANSKIEQSSPITSALADKLSSLGFTATAEEVTPATSNNVVNGVNLAKIEKLVLRREKKGRGGKTVTVVSGFNMQTGRLEDFCKAMRKALGCGGTVEDGTIILQGDITSSASKWLEKQGAKRIIIGN